MPLLKSTSVFFHREIKETVKESSGNTLLILVSKKVAEGLGGNLKLKQK
jgi:hypothetical protein